MIRIRKFVVRARLGPEHRLGDMFEVKVNENNKTFSAYFELYHKSLNEAFLT